MPATPRKSRRFGGTASHQRLMMANLVASLIAAEGIVTTEAKAKAVRPIAEKMITKAKKGGLHNHRQVVAYLNDKEIAAKLFDDVGPRYAERNGGYTRILKLGPRHGRLRAAVARDGSGLWAAPTAGPDQASGIGSQARGPRSVPPPAPPRPR